MKKTLIVLGCLSLGLAYAQQGRTHAQHNGADTRVGINTEKPVATLELKKVEGLEPTRVQGFLLPHLTQEERNEMEKIALVNGLMIFNTTKNCIDWWDGARWQCMDGSQKDAPTPKLPTTTPITLPQGLSITSGEHWIASIYDKDYLPYTPPTNAASWTIQFTADGADDTLIDVQGSIPATGITVQIPIIATATLTVPAYTTYAITPAEAWKDDTAKIIELSWTSQSLNTSSKYLTATLKVKDATTNQNLTQLDVREGLGNDYKGLLLGQFKIPSSYTENTSNSYTGTYDVRVISGIPDRNFADANHRFIYEPIEVTGTDGYKKVWLNNNLGAEYSDLNNPNGNFNPTQQATAHNDTKAYGSYFQWQRRADGHELKNSSTTAQAVTNPDWIAGHSNFITSYGWVIDSVNRDSSKYNLWGIGGSNNVCPEGFHVPTVDEWTSFLNAVKPTVGAIDIAARYSLRLTTAGWRHKNYGTYDHMGSSAWYHSSSAASQQGSYSSGSLVISHNSARVVPDTGVDRAYGHTVRCVSDY